MSTLEPHLNDIIAQVTTFRNCIHEIRLKISLSHSVSLSVRVHLSNIDSSSLALEALPPRNQDQENQMRHKTKQHQNEGKNATYMLRDLRQAVTYCKNSPA